MARHDPYKNFRFRVEIDGQAHGGFSDVAIGASFIDVVEYREGNEPRAVRKRPGLEKYGNVTLKRGITSSMELFNWFKAVANGDPASRKQVVIVLLGEDGSDQARFVVHSAWPRKFDVSDLNAKGNDVAIEELELVNEGVERVT